MSKRPAQADAVESKRPAAGTPKPVSTGVATAAAMKRLTLELKKISRTTFSDTDPDKFTAGPIDEGNFLLWESKFYNMDGYNGTKLKEMGLDCITLGMRFPAEYPFQPPFVWVKSPKMSGGYVWQNGAMCFEQLSPSGWTPATSIEALLYSIRGHIAGARILYDAKAFDFNTEQDARKDFRSIMASHRDWQKPTVRS